MGSRQPQPLKNEGGPIANYQRDADNAETEAHFLARVKQLAIDLGWMVYHAYDSRRSDPGFFDLVLCRGGVTILAELKSEAGRLSPAQVAWAKAATATGIHEIRGYGARVFLWRPRDHERIKEELR